MKVHILVTVREGTQEYSTLVFKTLRIGFPTAEVVVHLNGPAAESAVGELKDVGCFVVSRKEETTHQAWISSLLVAPPGNDPWHPSRQEPFWICDTDVIFYSSVEDWKFNSPLAGYLIPEFRDEFTKAVTRSRLHTSLMRIDPREISRAHKGWIAQHPDTQFNPPINLLNPVMVPLNNETYFYDTMSLAYHALGGTPFTPQQKDAYFHFHFGVCSDVVLQHLSNREVMEAARKDILDHPEKGRGMWRAQDRYFEARQFALPGTDVIAPVAPEDAELARAWNIELCKGNEQAMQTCDLWYSAVHGLDDLVDSLQDGRPRMSREQMIKLFFTFACLYNSPFYVANRDTLFPIVAQVTNTWADSVAWEHSPKAHLRTMADVFRICGDEFFIMVALLTGGYEHMRTMSMKIKERDWTGQHTAEGIPT